MRKFYLLNWMLLLIGLISSTALGQTETITITQTSAGITQTGYNSGAERTWTQEDVDFGAKAVMKETSQDRIQFKANDGVIYNTSPLPGKIVSISIDQTGSNVFNFFGGNTTRLVNSTSANYTVTGGTQVGSSSSTGWNASNFNETNYTFFAIKKGSGASYVSSITIEYEVATADEPPVITPMSFTAKVGDSGDYTVAVTNNPTAWTQTGLLPAGITFTDGVFSGTYTQAGSFSADLTATNNVPGSSTETFTWEIAKGDQTLTLANQNLVLGEADVTLPATTDQGFTVTYTSANPAIASVSGNTLSAVALGSTSITATATGDANYEDYIETITLTVTEVPILPNVIISQVYEGASNNKWIELTNLGATDADLSQLKVAIWSVSGDSGNGNIIPGEHTSDLTLTGTLSPGATFLIRHSSAANNVPHNPMPTAILGGNVTNFNGNDALALLDLDNNIVDAFGHGINNKDISFHRAAEVLGQNSTFTLTEWVEKTLAQVASADNTMSEYIGTHIFSFPTSIVWTTDNQWSNVTGPTINDDVVIEGVLVVGTDIASLEAKTLTVASNGSVVVKSGYALTVAGAIVNNATAAAFVVENDANLIQVQVVANTGEFTVYRNSNPMVRNDMTLWSSPVTGQGVRAFSPETLFNRFWTYDEANYTYKKLFDSDDAADINFATGNGYAIRVKNTLAAGQTTVHEGKFIGNLNNGTYTVDVSKTGYGFNLVGNPYASSIDGTAFLLENLDNVNSVHFWTHAHAVGSAEFTNNYLTYNRAGGTDLDDLENIASGQGFFVEAAYTGSIVFNNEMRTNDEAVFHKNNIERNRVWLSLSSDNKVINNTLLAYMTGATNGIDKQMDAKSITSDITSLYQVINNEAYSIQSRSLPFDQEDKVALGFNAVAAGTYTISIAKTDGLFAEGQEVYLLDKSANKIHDLATAYTFESEAGIFDERFEVVYGNRDLGLNTDLTNSKDVVVYTDNNTIVVESKNATLLSVELIDLQGRTVAAKNNIKANTYRVNTSAKGVLIVKIQTVDGKIITKKVIRK